ncbi:MAG: hypothetical protein H6706_20150 [Myxococcales bacterium]|nr:hypothetical protein [Myxococcales bacterium]
MARLPVNPWILVPAAVLGVAGLLAWQRARVPTRADWQAATAAVRAELAPGDGVTWLPEWAGEGRLYFHELPVFRVDAAAPDLARYDRVWVLGAFGRDAADLGDGLNILKSQSFGRVSLELVQVAGPGVVADLRAELDRARVTRVDGRGAETACDFWEGRGWVCDLRKSPEATRACLASSTAQRFARMRSDPTCGLPAWFDGPGRYGVGRGPQPVARDVRVIGGAPRRCVWFNPPAGRQIQRITWDAAPGERLVVDHGFTDHAIDEHGWDAARTKPATLRVRRGDAELATWTVEPTLGWKRQEIPLSGTGPLVLEVSGESDVDAHLCIDATVRSPR